MTQQYIFGEFSSLLGRLESTAGGLCSEVGSLRREVEVSPSSMLPELAREALDLTDLVCWAALEEGDATSFYCCAETAAALLEFTASANLLP